MPVGPGQQRDQGEVAAAPARAGSRPRRRRRCGPGHPHLDRHLADRVRRSHRYRACPGGIRPSPFWRPANLPVLILSEDEVEGAAATGSEVLSYPGYGIGPLDPMGRLEQVLEAAVAGRVVATKPGLPASSPGAAADLGRRVGGPVGGPGGRRTGRVLSSGRRFGWPTRASEPCASMRLPACRSSTCWTHVAAAMERGARPVAPSRGWPTWSSGRGSTVGRARPARGRCRRARLVIARSSPPPGRF